MRMPLLPRPQIERTIGPLYIKEVDGVEIANCEIVANDTRWAAVIDNDVVHTNDYMHDLKIRGVGSNKWGVRRYKMERARRERIVVRDIDTEHGFYESCHRGTLAYVDCAGINIGAQFIQHRLSWNRADPDWQNERIVKVVNCQAREVGQLSGAGRAGFAYSIKDCGPNSEVLMAGVWSKNVKQSRVAKRSDGTWADSFGAICVEFCGRLELTDFHVEHKNPDRDVIQLFDYANKAATMTGPRNIVVRRGVVERSGNLSVRVGDGDSILIEGVRGNGRIKAMVRDAGGVWREDQSLSCPISGGFTWNR